MMTLLAAASCTSERLPQEEPSVSVPGAVMTKVINTPADSEDGAVLLCVTEEAADAWAAGDRTLVEDLSADVEVVSLKPENQCSRSYRTGCQPEACLYNRSRQGGDRKGSQSPQMVQARVRGRRQEPRGCKAYGLLIGSERAVQQDSGTCIGPQVQPLYPYAR